MNITLRDVILPLLAKAIFDGSYYYYYDLRVYTEWVLCVRLAKIDKLSTFANGTHSGAPFNDNQYLIFYV